MQERFSEVRDQLIGKLDYITTQREKIKKAVAKVATASLQNEILTPKQNKLWKAIEMRM